MSTTQAPIRSWLVGPAADLLLGCGVLYMGVFAALAVAGPQIRGLTTGAIIILLTLLLSAPHYGATLLRVFENRADRGKYHFFAVHVTLALVVAFVVGQHSIQAASWLLTIYIIWSPWHYTGQNYGLAVMFLRRAGVPLPPGVKRLLHASFILSYVLLFFVVYAGSEGGADAARGYGAAGYEKVRVESLGIPDFVGDVATPVVGAAYLIAILATIVALLRRARARDLLPVGLLLLTQALWFSLPMAARFSGFGVGIDPFDPALRPLNFTWIALGHAVQYLWVTSYYARSAPNYRGTSRYLGKAAVAGMAIWTLPLVVFAPWALGGMSGDAGFYLLMASCINIHHFILDGAIWKLRDSRIANALLRPVPSAPPPRMSRRPWLRKGVWAVAGAGACLALVQYSFETRLIIAANQLDAAASARALDGLAWFGRDSALDRRRVAKQQLDGGDVDRAIASLRRSLELAPEVAGYSELAYLEAGRNQSRAALQALEAGLSLEPERLGLLHRAGEAQLALGRPDLARRYLERALRVDSAHEPSRRALHRALQRISANPARGTDQP